MMNGTYRPSWRTVVLQRIRRQLGYWDETEYGLVDGQLEVQLATRRPRRLASRKTRSPDPTSVWPRVAPICETWIGTDDRTLLVGGVHGFDTVLHSLDVDESADEVGLMAKIAFTREAARRRVGASVQMGEASVGIRWSAEVRLQNSLAGRRVIDRGVLQIEILGSEKCTPLHEQVIADLGTELAAATRPAERRRIRHLIKSIRLNPDKVVLWTDHKEADEERTT